MRDFITRIVEEVRNNDLSDNNLINKYTTEANILIKAERKKIPLDADVRQTVSSGGVLLAEETKTVLSNCKTKLQLYKANLDGEYLGGVEYTELIKMIDGLFDKLEASKTA